MEWDEPDREQYPRASARVTVTVPVIHDALAAALREAAPGFQARLDPDSGEWVTPLGRVLRAGLTGPAQQHDCITNGSGLRIGPVSWDVDCYVSESRDRYDAIADLWLRLGES